MQQDYLVSEQTIPYRARGSFACSWALTGLHTTVLLCASLLLLLLSTTDPGPFGFVTRLCWLGCFTALAFLNIGAGFAAYVSSLAIYSPLRVEGWSSLIQRPDNYALAILFVAMVSLVLRRRNAWPRFAIYILVFLLYCGFNTEYLSPTSSATLLRALVVPAVACVLMTMVGFYEEELNGMLRGMALLGAYMGFESILEGVHATRWILPPWITNPSLLPFDPSIGDNEGRSGGTLMVPALNGLLLSLILVMIFPLIRRRKNAVVVIAMLLCAAGGFFTLERAVWLGLAVALFWFPGWYKSRRDARSRRTAVVFIALAFLVAAGAVASGRLRDSDTILFRFAMWGAGFRLFFAHPLIGLGFFNFPTALESVQQGFGSQLLSYRTVTEHTAAHNTTLTGLVEFGLIGFVLGSTMFFRIIRAVRSNAQRIWGNQGASWLLAFVAVFIVNAQFITTYEGTTNTAFFGLLGAIAGAQSE